MSVRSFQQLLVAQANDRPKPRIVDEPCSLCERRAGPHDPVVIRPGEHIAGHYGCLRVHDNRIYAIETALSNPEATR